MGRPPDSGKQKGQSLRSAFERIGINDLQPAAVVTVPDRLLSFPHNLFGRKLHERRFGVIVSNARICVAQDAPLVVVVPMTHNIEIRAQTDVLISHTAENGLEMDSLAQLHLIQPVMKTKIIQKLGVLDAHTWEGLIERLFWMTDRE